LYTRGGDRGETGLYGSRRVPKDSLRVEAYGTIDELNSCLGVAIAECDGQIAAALRAVQAKLFTAGADLATDSKEIEEREQKTKKIPRISRSDTAELEEMIDALQTKLPPLKSFILPGGTRLSAAIHLSRAVCRRAERRVIELGRSEPINQEMVPFLNRLSTYLFNLAREANLLEGKNDELWKASSES
jgi:cob(I)alamin adenosyltransferase